MNGRFDFLVLHLLSKEKMYGFQIIKKLFDATDGEIEMKTGTLYPLLQTLENKPCSNKWKGSKRLSNYRKGADIPFRTKEAVDQIQDHCQQNT